MKQIKSIIMMLSIVLLVSGIAAGNLSGGATIGGTTSDSQDVIITVSGSNPMTVERYLSYTDPGAVAIDPTTNQAVTVTAIGLPIDTSIVGIVNVTYQATGANGNTTSINRTINILDTKAPDNVDNLNVVSTTWSTITIEWNNPVTTTYPNQDYVGVVMTVKSNGVIVSGYDKRFIGSSGNYATYVIDGLKPNTVYSILLQSADDQDPLYGGS